MVSVYISKKRHWIWFIEVQLSVLFLIWVQYSIIATLASLILEACVSLLWPSSIENCYRWKLVSFDRWWLHLSMITSSFFYGECLIYLHNNFKRTVVIRLQKLLYIISSNECMNACYVVPAVWTLVIIVVWEVLFLGR